MARIQTLAQAIASTMQALANCERSGNAEWAARHGERLDALAGALPSGSGFDSGTTFDRDASTPTKLVFQTSFHHMNEQGYYCGWSDHTVTVRPEFEGIDVRVSGRNVRDIKDYIAETFDYVLTEPVPEWSRAHASAGGK